ncbi:MAG TPA: hypothetical protein VHM70_13405, partial [Polyangiaceae bacterium]|nr:hypothetical protein [Polyangiaceae bacterium]
VREGCGLPLSAYSTHMMRSQTRVRCEERVAPGRARPVASLVACVLSVLTPTRVSAEQPAPQPRAPELAPRKSPLPSKALLKAQCIDAAESNDSEATASDLGTVTQSTPLTRTGTIHVETDVDYFRVHARQTSSAACIPGSSKSFELRVKLTAPPDLGSVRLRAANSVEVPVKGGESGTLLFELQGKCGSPDQFDFLFAIEPLSAPLASCKPYSLEFVFSELH